MVVFLLLAAAGRLVATSESHTLTDAGSIAAIVAGTIALLLLLWGVGRWAMRAYASADIAHGLHVEQHKLRLEHVDQRTHVYVGLDLRNGIGRALHYRTRGFRVTFRGRPSDLPLALQKQTSAIGPLAPRSWYRDPVVVGLKEVPGELTMTYEILYGSSPKRMRRVICGAVRTELRSPDLQSIQAGVWEELRPETDKRLDTPREVLKAWIRGIFGRD